MISYIFIFIANKLNKLKNPYNWRSMLWLCHSIFVSNTHAVVVEFVKINISIPYSLYFSTIGSFESIKNIMCHGLQKQEYSSQRIVKFFQLNIPYRFNKG